MRVSPMAEQEKVLGFHDFRHSFAVKSLRKMIYNNDDIMSGYAALANILDHKNIYATKTICSLLADIVLYVTETVQNVLGGYCPRNGGIR